jgi:hypothetical protein
MSSFCYPAVLLGASLCYLRVLFCYHQPAQQSAMGHEHAATVYQQERNKPKQSAHTWMQSSGSPPMPYIESGRSGIAMQSLLERIDRDQVKVSVSEAVASPVLRP